MANHVLTTFRPGQLVAYQDGRKVFDTDAVQGDLSDWRDEPRLALGADPVEGERNFAGRVEGIALYARFFEAEEAVAPANAYADRRTRREPRSTPVAPNAVHCGQERDERDARGEEPARGGASLRLAAGHERGRSSRAERDRLARPLVRGFRSARLARARSGARR